AFPTAQPTPTPTKTEDWEQVDVNGVRLSIVVPRGWKVHKTGEGLVIAERFSTMETSATGMGIQINLFVHTLDGFDLPNGDDTNVAWAVLEQIIQQPTYIGNAQVSAPSGFKWDNHDAAYYLLNDGDGSLSVLVAVMTTDPERLVVCNISSPARQASRIRDLLPQVLSTLTINGIKLDISALNDLPDPLQFPGIPYTPTP